MAYSRCDRCGPVEPPGLDHYGKIGTNTLAALVPHMDAFALEMYASFDPTAVMAAVVALAGLVYPHPAGAPGTRINGAPPPPGRLHETKGRPGNQALDFMAPGGTMMLAPEAGTITSLSGTDPTEGVHDGDIFGLSIHLAAASGLKYFATHLSDRTVHESQVVQPGDVIGHVGHWPNDPGRSHTHLGVTHPSGDVAATQHIIAVSNAQHVAAHALV